jgi:hypothetical protein
MGRLHPFFRGSHARQMSVDTGVMLQKVQALFVDVYSQDPLAT